MTDLSPTGLFVQTRAILLPGEPVTVVLLPPDLPRVEVQARVVRKSLTASFTSLLRRAGVGLELTGIPEGYAALRDDPAQVEESEGSWLPEDVVIEIESPDPEIEPGEPEIRIEFAPRAGAEPEVGTGMEPPAAGEPEVPGEREAIPAPEADATLAAPPEIAAPTVPSDAPPAGLAQESGGQECQTPTESAAPTPERRSGAATAIDALIVDDGELDDVRDQLRALGARTARRQVADHRAPTEAWDHAPTLLVVAARSALRMAVTARASSSGTLAIAVVDDASQTLREQLRRQGYQYAVQRPVHPDALRALLAAALYTGPQRRRRLRVPIGAPIYLSAGLRRRSATLLDLSSGGCRLLVDRWTAPGTTMQLIIPRGLTGERELRVRGKVMRAAWRPGAPEPEQVTLVLGFDQLAERAAAGIESLVQAHSGGPASVQREGESDTASSNRRGDTRYRVATWGICQLDRDPEASRVVFGRDISLGGMNIGAEPDLIEGDRLQLVIRDDTSGEPLTLEALVARDDGPRGVALRFTDPRPYLEQKLAPLLGSRPALEDLAAGEETARPVTIARSDDQEAA